MDRRDDRLAAARAVVVAEPRRAAAVRARRGGDGDYGPLVALSAAVTGGMQENFAAGMHFAVVCAEDMPRVDRGGTNAAACKDPLRHDLRSISTSGHARSVPTRPVPDGLLPDAAVRGAGAGAVRRARPGHPTASWRRTWLSGSAVRSTSWSRPISATRSAPSAARRRRWRSSCATRRSTRSIRHAWTSCRRRPSSNRWNVGRAGAAGRAAMIETSQPREAVRGAHPRRARARRRSRRRIGFVAHDGRDHRAARSQRCRQDDHDADGRTAWSTPDAGRARRRRRCRDQPARCAGASIGMLSDARGLYARLTARENIMYYADLRRDTAADSPTNG